MEFVYIVMSYPADSCYPYSRHVSDIAPTNIYAIYMSMAEAVATVSEIYENGWLGVKKDTEVGIVKRKIDKRRKFADTIEDASN